MKPVPFTVKVKAGSPAVVLTGPMVLITGTGLFTARSTELELPPPGAGLNTVIGNAPVDCMSAAVIWAVS